MSKFDAFIEQKTKLYEGIVPPATPQQGATPPVAGTPASTTPAPTATATTPAPTATATTPAPAQAAAVQLPKTSQDAMKLIAAILQDKTIGGQVQAEITKMLQG